MFETVCVFCLILMNASTAVSSNVTESTNNSQDDQGTASVATSTLENTVIESSSTSPLQRTTVTSHLSQIQSAPVPTATTSSLQSSQSPTSSIETSSPPMKIMTSSAVVTSSQLEETSTSTQGSSDVTSGTLKTTTFTPNESSPKPLETMTLSITVTTAQMTSSHPLAVVTSSQGIESMTSYSVVIVATSSQLSAVSKTTRIVLPSQGETGTIATDSLGITTAFKIGSSEQKYQKESISSKKRPTAWTSGLATQTTESPKDLVTKASPIASSTQLAPTDEAVTTQLPEGPVTTPHSTAPDSTTEPGQVEASTSTGRKVLLVTIYIICAVLFVAVIVLVVVLWRSIKKKRSKNLRTQVSADVEDGNVLTLRAVKNDVSKENLTEEPKEDAEESKPLLDGSGVENEEANVVQDDDVQREENSKPEELSSEKTDTERSDDN